MVKKVDKTNCLWYGTHIDVCMHDKVLILCLCAYGTPIPPPHIIMIIVGAAPSACFRAKPGFRAADLCNPVGLPPGFIYR